jgi:hypothetical protein
MLLKKSLSLALIISQLAWASAYADTSTPETKLLSAVVELSGKNLTKSELQQQLTADLQQYDAEAPADGRVERTEQALVALGVDTPEQAQSFEQQVVASAKTLANSKFESTTDAQNAFQMQVVRLIAGSQGAQFSYCGGGGVLLGWVAGVALMASGIVMFQSPNTSENVVGAVVGSIGICVAGLIGIQDNVPFCGGEE